MIQLDAGQRVAKAIEREILFGGENVITLTISPFTPAIDVELPELWFNCVAYNNAPTTVKGIYLDDYNPDRHGFLYLYFCSECGNQFTETTPEVSAPAICEKCYHKDDLQEDKRLKYRRKYDRAERRRRWLEEGK